MVNRRSVLIGLGAVMAGGGALFATGAFTTVEAERTVSVETADDADALLALAAADGNEYVEETDGTIEINLDGNDEGAEGLNQNAITTFEELVQVTNQGTQEVDEITLEFTETPPDVDPANTFSFPVSTDDGSDEVANGENILTGNNDVPDNLESGESVVFGLAVDLISGGVDNDLPDDGEYTLTITANSAE